MPMVDGGRLIPTNQTHYHYVQADCHKHFGSKPLHNVSRLWSSTYGQENRSICHTCGAGGLDRHYQPSDYTPVPQEHARPHTPERSHSDNRLRDIHTDNEPAAHRDSIHRRRKDDHHGNLDYSPHRGSNERQRRREPTSMITSGAYEANTDYQSHKESHAQPSSRIDNLSHRENRMPNVEYSPLTDTEDYY